MLFQLLEEVNFRNGDMQILVEGRDFILENKHRHKEDDGLDEVAQANRTLPYTERALMRFVAFPKISRLIESLAPLSILLKAKLIIHDQVVAS